MTEPTPAEAAAAFAPWSIPAEDCTHCSRGWIAEDRGPTPIETYHGIHTVRNFYACGYCTAGPRAKAEWERETAERDAIAAADRQRREEHRTSSGSNLEWRPEPTMYPLTDGPDSWTRFDTFAELRDHVEQLPEELNMVTSWFFSYNDDNTDDPATEPEFAMLVWSPAKGKTHQLAAPYTADRRHVIESWIRGYVRARVERWYGW